MRVGIGLVGYSFMGAVHSHAWRSVNHFFDVPARAELAAVCGRDGDAVVAAAVRLGYPASETSWRRLIARPDVDLVDVCTPGSSHAEISIAALRAGKHVLCEKPLANSVGEAREMAAAAGEASGRGVRSMVGFNYRRVPAVALARRLVEGGRLGQLRHVRVAYLQDWLADPGAPLTWRLRRETAGSGAVGDLGAHAVDLAEFVTASRITGVSALTETFVTDRRVVGEPGRTGRVTVDDAVVFLTRFAGGAIGSFEATRYALGRKNSLRLEVNGERGSIAFDLERLNELQFADGTDDPAEVGFRRILVTEPDHPYLSAWWPPGHVLGYEHTFTHEVRDFLDAVGAGADPTPSFTDGLRVQLVLDAIERSAAAGCGFTEVEAA